MKQSLDTRTKLLTQRPFSLMLELSIPAVLGMVVVGLYNMMDSIFVGQMVGSVQMGAVSVSYPFTLINAGSAAMLGVGSASVLSRAIGKKDENTVKKIMGNLVAAVVILSVIYTVIGMVFTRQLLSLAGASDNILNYAEKYLRIIFAGSLFVNFFQSANMVIRGEGQLKKAMFIIASGAILNIILDPIFIALLNPYGMGIEGAAYATVLSQFVQAVITVWYFKKKSPNVKIGRIRIDGPILRQVLAVGVSALLMQVLTLVQQTVIYRVAANYGGETSQILLGAALRFWNFSFVPLWGISQGFQPAAGTNYGAKDYDRVKLLTKVFIAAATVLSLLGGLGMGAAAWLLHLDYRYVILYGASGVVLGCAGILFRILFDNAGKEAQTLECLAERFEEQLLPRIQRSRALRGGERSPKPVQPPVTLGPEEEKILEDVFREYLT